MFKDITQVHTEYDGQWVFMINCTEGEHGSVAGGEVVLHNENRDFVFQGMEKYDYEPSMTYFTYAGRIPEEISVIL